MKKETLDRANELKNCIIFCESISDNKIKDISSICANFNTAFWSEMPKEMFEDFAKCVLKLKEQYTKELEDL